ncbi:MAG: hypothetical protein IJI36_03620, partial [Kiritimatiellae bacterium]|nr:hypothetical protein [Kiritimatiellia bacterium]
MCAVIVVFAAAVGAGTNGVELADADLHLRYVPEARTAYISRGRVCEDRPVMTQLVRVDGALGPFGRAGLWHWDVSALGNRRENLFRRSFHEVDWGFFYRYDWEINKDWTLASEGMKDWLTFPGARGRLRGRSDATIHEYRLYEALKNPYLTPWCLIRHSTHPNDWTYYRVGVQHGFPLVDNLTLTPIFYAELGDERHFNRRYGQNVSGRSYHSGPQALVAQLELAWKVTDWFSVTTSLS